jgi:hypothetical protein
MTLGNRCDEIVRLIDETLGSVAADSAVTARAAHPSAASLRGADATRARRLVVVPDEPKAPAAGSSLFR